MKIVILFESITAAREVAYILRGEWDGYNSLFIRHLNTAAIELAASLIEAEFSYAGDCCYIQNRRQANFDFGTPRAGKSIMFPDLLKMRRECLHYNDEC